MNEFLPINLNEGKKYYKNFNQFDVIFITGDPYYDHPLSGTSLLARLCDKKGYKVGIIAQPISDIDFQSCGKPKYFFCISSGLLDSMLANFTPMLKQRDNVLVPTQAVIKYTQKIKNLFPNSITIIGGVESTIRRFTHFDYKENKLRRGILNDSKADLLIYGNAERSLLLLLEKFKNLKSLDKIKPFFHLIDGLSYRIKKNEIPNCVKFLPSYEDCLNDKNNFNKLTLMSYTFPNEAFIEQSGLGYIMHNKRSLTLSDDEMDFIYSSNFSRKIHPKSKNYNFNKGMVSRLETSVIIGRGCFGSCNFCVIPLVQGKEIAKRSIKNIISEIESLCSKGYFKIADLTLPTLNMFGAKCSLYNIEKEIYSSILEKNIKILVKEINCNQTCAECKNRILTNDLKILLLEIEKLKQKYPKLNIELRSAIRHDLILNQPQLFREIMKYTSRLKIAPENLDNNVLKLMNKSNKNLFEKFIKEFNSINKEQKTNKKLVPYFVVAHPGSTIESIKLTKKFCDENNLYINLTQIFTPTPGTMSTSMYFTEKYPYSNKKIFVPKSFREKKDQKNILFSQEDMIDDNA